MPTVVVVLKSNGEVETWSDDLDTRVIVLNQDDTAGAETIDLGLEEPVVATTLEKGVPMYRPELVGQVTARLRESANALPESFCAQFGFEREP